MPDTIHVPPMAPINNKIMMAGAQLEIFALNSSSRFSQSSFFER